MDAVPNHASQESRIMEPLHPIHASVRAERTRYTPRPRPQNMDRIAIDNSARETIEGIALGIFTDMTNAGCSLQETLATIYLSGMQNASELLKE